MWHGSVGLCLVLLQLVILTVSVGGSRLLVSCKDKTSAGVAVSKLHTKHACTHALLSHLASLSDVHIPTAELAAHGHMCTQALNFFSFDMYSKALGGIMADGNNSARFLAGALAGGYDALEA
eukprot:GHUV01028935.1.p1 GENE.GHUV01028935.1~~GHUV01028935.1.p1  ORF type:complete len:122 (+),score=10.77 GHUV01028935.1:224-589(+)